MVQPYVSAGALWLRQAVERAIRAFVARLLRTARLSGSLWDIVSFWTMSQTIHSLKGFSWA